MLKAQYRRGAHTVTDFKYHFVWKIKYSYHVLKGELALRLRDIIRDICSENKMNVIKGNVRSNHTCTCLGQCPCTSFTSQDRAIYKR